ncbi:MAG: hypothetical protein U0X41_06915 [Chitinophagales bacterium]|jgi:hypothetical protein
MDIHIHPDKKLAEIQHEFHKHFPFLKLEFYAHTHQPGEISGKSDKLNLSIPIREWTEGEDSFEWHINEQMTVAELEGIFQQKSHIGVQVFRKSGLNWLQTGTTDKWTLEAQNAKGREMSEELPKEEPEDYHEHE